MLVKFEQTVWSKTTRNLELFAQTKPRFFFYYTTFDKELMPFWKNVSVAEIIS